MKEPKISELIALEVVQRFLKTRDWERLLNDAEFYCYRLGRRGPRPKELFLKTLTTLLAKHTILATTGVVNQFTVISVSVGSQQDAVKVIETLNGFGGDTGVDADFRKELNGKEEDDSISS